MANNDAHHKIMTIKHELSAKLLDLHARYKRALKPWREQIEEYATAYSMAFKKHKEVLVNRKDLQKARLDLCMSIVGAVSGSALNWVGYAIKQAPQYSASVAAEAIKELFVGHIADAVKATTAVGLNIATPKINVPSFGADPENFKTDLLKSYDAQIDFVKDMLVKTNTGILYDNQLATALYNESNGDLRKAESAATDFVSNFERNWCKTVKYYTTRPSFPPRANMARMIERAMWARWIAAVVRFYHRYKKLPDNIHSNYVSAIAGWSVTAMTSHPIEDRLVELNVMKPDGSADKKRIKTARKELEGKHGRWETKSPELDNPGRITDFYDMKSIVVWANSYKPEKIGNF